MKALPWILGALALILAVTTVFFAIKAKKNSDKLAEANKRLEGAGLEAVKTGSTATSANTPPSGPAPAGTGSVAAK